MRKKLMLPDNVTSKLKDIKAGKPLEKKKPDPPKVDASKNNGDVSIRDIKKPEIEEKKAAPSIKVDGLDGKPAAPK